jgi:sugar lactone lactonase YvrE
VGAAARFAGLTGVASDGAGNCFVADNETIRKVVVATGAVTTFAGASGVSGSTDGTATAARFGNPNGLTADGAGNLYLADGGNGAIRKIAISTGTVSTLTTTNSWPASKNGTATYAPYAVVADGAGNLYVANIFPDDIATFFSLWKIVIATGAVTPITDWSSSASYARLFNIATDGAGSLYLGDGASSVLKVAVADGTVTTAAGGSNQLADASAGLMSPESVISDGAGGLFVAERSAIRKVVIATGAVSTLEDTVGPTAVATDGAGNLCATDGGVIQKIVIATGAVTTLAGAPSQPGSTDGTGSAARFSQPWGMTGDGNGNLYVVDSSGGTIRKIVVATGAVTTLSGNIYQPTGIASDGAGNLYFTSGVVQKLVLATGDLSTLTVGPGRDPGQPGPASIASDGAGNLYFDSAGTTIWGVATATGALTPVAGAAGQSGSRDAAGTAARFAGVIGIASDGAGNLYVADAGNSTIRKVVLATRAVTTLAGAAGKSGTVDGTGKSARFGSLHGIAYDGAGSLYVADGNTVRKIVIATAAVSTVVGAPGQMGVSLGPLPASLGHANGVAMLPTGELAIADDQEHAVLIAHF